MSVDLSTFVVLAVIFLGVALRHRKTSKDTDEFHIANWSAGTFAVLASVVGLFGAGEIATFTDLYSLVGGGIIVFFLGAVVGFVCIYIFADKFYVETRTLYNSKTPATKAYHINDVVYDRFGTFALLLFTALAAVSLFTLFLIQVIVGSDLIAIGAGVRYEWAVIGVCSFVAVYVIISGLRGIYSTDKVQVIGLFTALILISYSAVSEFNISISAEFSRAFVAIDLVTFLTLFIPGFFAAVGADVLQRIISVRAVRDLRRISIAAAGGWLFLGMILVVFSAGVAGYATGEQTGFIEFLSSSSGTTRVVIIVGLLCALLSTADTEAHSAALLVNRALSKDSPPSVSLSRVLIAVVCLGGGILALFFKDLATLYVIMLNIFLILGPIVFAIVFKRGNAVSVNTTLIMATLLLIYFAVSDLLYATSHLLGIEVLLLAVLTSFNLFFRSRRLGNAV